MRGLPGVVRLPDSGGPKTQSFGGIDDLYDLYDFNEIHARAQGESQGTENLPRDG
ncbi:MAG: hypothetical protein ABIW76_03285 [Fibrobacteria bacterium]